MCRIGGATLQANHEDQTKLNLNFLTRINIFTWRRKCSYNRVRTGA